MIHHPQIIVESDIPTPNGRFASNGLYESLRQTLSGMADGQSFMWDENTMVYNAARQAGVKIKTRKITGDGYRVWRVGKRDK